MNLKAPFPWFGGKSPVARWVWDAFGNIQNYVEPFCGSSAVLLSRPNPQGIETINDKDGFVSNFWRAVRFQPEEVAQWADFPVSEVDLIARHRWLCNQGFVEQMKNDPLFCDPQIAGWWVWGQCAWIGSGWCSRPNSEQIPHLGNKGTGINRVITTPNLKRHEYILQQMQDLSLRLRDVRITCGDWTRVLGPSVTVLHAGTTGIFLDPPYADDDHAVDYAGGGSVWHDVCRWCEENGTQPKLKIVLCGYKGTWNPPAEWEELNYSKHVGYSNNKESSRSKSNAKRETIWCSPNCRKTLSLF